MLEPLSSTIHGVIEFTWPMILISVIILVSFRVIYLIKNKEKMVLYKELLMLSFIIYILCLFQVVTFQDDTSWASNNFVPFREILRYNITSKLFIKNVLGNMIMFMPFGLFASLYLKVEKINLPLMLTIIASVSIETVQLVIGRVFDVDDIILNVIGALLGFAIYRLIYKFNNKIPEKYRKNWLLDIIIVIIIILVVRFIVL